MAEPSSPQFLAEEGRLKAGLVETKQGLPDDMDRDLIKDVANYGVEKKSNPEKAKGILDSMDADEILFRQALEKRMKWGGLGGRLEDSFASLGGKITSGVLKLGGSALASTLLARGVKSIFHAGNPATGAIVGGVMGGFWGYVKTRNKNESVSSWENRTDILEASEEDLSKMPDDKLEFALGIINQAVKDGKVRGRSIQKIELARKIRVIKNSLEERNEAIDKEEKNPVMKRIDNAIEATTDDGKTISAMAGEQYKSAYEKIIQNDRKKAILSGVKGALVGAGIGAISGWLMDKYGGGGGDQSTSGDAGLKGQEAELLRKHLENMNPLGSPSSDHLANLVQHGGNVNGFAGPDLNHFTEMVKHGSSMKDLHQFAEMRNIDFGARIGDHGQAVGQFIMNHKDQFLSLSPDVQRQMLSYPSLANEIFNAAISNSGVARDTVTTAIVGGAGLAVIGGGFGLANRGQKNIDNENAKILSDSRTAAKTEMATWQTEQDAKDKEKAEADKQKKNENIENSRNSLIGKEIYFVDIKKLDSKYVAVNPKENRKFKIVDIRDDKLIFAVTREDEKVYKNPASAKASLPQITLEKILTAEGRIDDTKLRLIVQSETGAGSSAEDRPEINKADYEKLKNTSSLVGRVENFGSMGKRLTFSSPGFAKSLGEVNFVGNREKNIPMGQELKVKVTNVVFKEGSDPEVVVDILKENNGNDYRLEKYCSDKVNREQFVADMKRWATAGEATKLMAYIDEDSSFYVLDSQVGNNIHLKELSSGTEHIFSENDLKNKNMYRFVRID